MSATRLLVLGAVRIFQPAHGYSIRRELLSWDVESWAALNPGSIYHMLRTLARDGLLAEEGDAGRSAGPARVAYRLTMDGENAFAGLLARALWHVDERDPNLLAAGLCFLPTLTRAEAAEAFEAREAALRLRIKTLEARRRQLLERRTVPAHSAELFDVDVAHSRGELEWVAAARRRIDEGYYRFAGEPGADEGPVGGRWPGPLERA
jgi:DNA-binding PadR family transcriptional regulator